jgi:hypothetical protein
MVSGLPRLSRNRRAGHGGGGQPVVVLHVPERSRLAGPSARQRLIGMAIGLLEESRFV